ncbi:MAG TPA: queuosine precursor transporter [Candidatus Tectomicrobia bacterium]|nr:queuosine precursor transporter [Candidatus Tectomicrobia bacterium]
MSWRFVTCAALFVTCLLTANTTAAKLVDVGGLTLTAAIVIFPLSYVIGDVLTEVWGYGPTRRVIWLGFACNAVMVVAIALGGALPAAPFWKGQAAYDEILGQAPRIVVASFLAYLVGEFSNAFVLARLKIATAGRWLWLRTIGSTVVGQALDTVVFVTLAFAGTLPAGVLGQVVAGQWAFKVAYEAAATPLTYAAVGWLKSREQVDVFDRDTDFNPLSLRG